MSSRQRIIPRSLQLATIQEIKHLLDLAEKGKIIGIAYVVQPESGSPCAGSAGSMARDALRTSGAFLSAAVTTKSS